MWNLFKSELRYRRDIMILYVLAFSAVFLLTRFFPLKAAAYHRSAIQFLLYMLIFFLAGFPVNPWFREKRTRRVMLLPISPRRAAMARLAVELVYWLLLVALLLLFCLLAPDFKADASLLYSLCAQTGVLLSIYFWLTYLIDIILPLRMSGSISFLEKIILTMLLFLVIWISILSLLVLVSAIDSLIYSRDVIFLHLFKPGWIPVIILLSGLTAAMCSVFFFEHRQGYLEY